MTDQHWTTVHSCKHRQTTVDHVKSCRDNLTTALKTHGLLRV